MWYYSLEQIAQNVEQEWKRIQKRKRLTAISPTSNLFVNNQLNQLLPSASPTTPASPVASTSDNNKPIFTLKQVQIICDKMLKEREKQIREEYDKVLNQKLSGKFVGINAEKLQQYYNALFYMNLSRFTIIGCRGFWLQIRINQLSLFFL